MLDCEHNLFLDFKRNLIIDLQTAVLKFAEENVTPLVLLKAALNNTFIPLLEALDSANADL